MRPCKRTSPACGGGGSPDEPDDGKYRRPVFIGALTFGFGLGVALFFSTGAPLPCKVCYPAAWLSLVLFALRDKACVPVAGALLLSAPACSCSSSPASSPAWRRPSNGRASHSTAR